MEELPSENPVTIRELSITLVMLLPALAGAVALQRARAMIGWPRRVFKWGGLLLIVSSLVVLFNSWARPRSRMPAPVFTTESPTGEFVARVVEPDGDPLPTYFVRISIRHKGSILAENVFRGGVEPNVDWIDGRKLQLIYPDTPAASCGGSWSGVAIICKPVPEVEFKPRLRE